MFLHYIKTAWRSICRNWIYSLLSVCCLAIGTAMFSMLFYGINYDDFFENRLPGHKRSRFVCMTIPGNHVGQQDRIYRSQLPYLDYKTLLDLPEIESVSVGGGMSAHLSFADSVRVYGMGPVKGVYVDGDYFKYWNLSLLYGDRVPRNENEIVVSESLLKRMGYDKDISQCLVKTETYRIGREYQIVNVVRDDKWRRSCGYDVFFSTQDWKVQSIPFYDIDVVLKEGADVNEINNRLSLTLVDDGEGNSKILQLAGFHENPGDRMEKLLLSMLSILVLLVAVTNYLKHLAMVLKQRNRANIIRYSLGARQSSLAFMLVAEVIIILLFSFAIAQYVTILVCTWVNQTVYMGDRYFHLADLIWLNTLTTVCVALVGVMVCRIAVFGQNKVLRNRIVAYQRERKVLKYIIIGIETSVAVMALASVLDIASTAPKPYNPLSRSETRRTFFVQTEEGDSYTDNQQAFCNLVRRMPQVEDMVSSEYDWNGSHASQFNVQGRMEWLFEKGYDIRYFRFFNIPIEWLDPTHPTSGYLIDRLTYERYMRDSVDLSSISTVSYNTVTPVHVTGVYEHYMLGDPYETAGDVGGLFQYHPISEYYTNFFVRFREGVSKTEAETLLRDAWKEVNPSSMEDVRISSIPKYTDDEYRFTALGFQIGGMVCILLVILSVTSSISAETNVRRKEVALRKINGAKGRNIMALFIKPYCIILAVAFPIGILASLAMLGHAGLYVWIAPVTLVTIALIAALSVWSKIRAIMRTNPADVIKSE
jgi:hypothetical protein